MNEQRLQAYLSLIQELLDCPSGEENQILNQHLELLDGAFVQVCEQKAEQLQSDGQENNAGFLRHLAQRVGAFLAQQGTGGNQQEVLQQFWQQLLKAEMESGGNEVAVHQVMLQNMGLIVPNLGDTIVQSIPGLLAQFPDQAEGVAGLIQNTCNSIQQFPYGRYAEALEIAIRGYGVVLELRADNPEKRAQTLNNLGVARRTQAEMGINPAANLDRAITAYDEAAEILRRLKLEKDLSSTLTNLGVAHQTQAQMGINPVANLEGAITAYHEAAAIRRALGLDREISSTLTNLAVAYLTQAEMGINPAANLEQAISHYQEALEILTPEAFPIDWAMTQNNLANAYNQRIHGERAANIEQAMQCYHAALRILNKESFPEEWARTYNNLGAAYSLQIRGDQRTNIDTAINCYKTALEVYSRSSYPKDWARIQNNLGTLYLKQYLISQSNES
ncbi:tetratricopeptide repeat protein [Planktothrix rubescens]|uniref:Tetratricopeptide repeat protein n=1 Tax=Planktothrix rubescens CCAP 1459/22 TaxID=329571 RepID=A0A6J7ZIM1_PLARU|nr:conserved hypothetical protein [Planktothrix rubescens NIVA-CYA 18]